VDAARGTVCLWHLGRGAVVCRGRCRTYAYTHAHIRGTDICVYTHTHAYIYTHIRDKRVQVQVPDIRDCSIAQLVSLVKAQANPKP